jgi:hypothetical protein
VAGSKDPEFPPAITESMAQQLPAARLVMVPGLAHDFPARLTSDYIAPFLISETVESPSD